jgi:glycine cleavage system T protein
MSDHVVNRSFWHYISFMAKQSLLTTFHQSNGAQFVERDGWLLPAQFGNSATEYAAVRSAVGFIDLLHRGLLQLTGADRVSFLQGMVSNDVKALQPGTGQYATILNQQGKVLGDTRVLCSEKSFYLDLWEDIKDKIAEHLNRYLVADEVEITDRTDEYGIISLQGPQSEAGLQKLVGQAGLPELLAEHRMVNIDGAQVCVVRASSTGEPGFDLIIPRSHLLNVAQQLTEAGKGFSGAWVGEEVHNILRVEAGIPRYGVDFTEDNLLLEVGLDQAVSFTKGCYLGQEVVERIRSRGHVNKKLVGLTFESRESANRGDVLFADKPVGTITSSVDSPALGKSIALGYVHKDYWNPDTRLSVNHDGVSLDAKVTPLPFVRSPRGPVSSS